MDRGDGPSLGPVTSLSHSGQLPTWGPGMGLGVPVAYSLLFSCRRLLLQLLQLTLQILDDICLLLVQEKAALDFPMSIL